MKQASISSRSGTDIARLHALQDEDIDFSDIPEITPEMFARAAVVRKLTPRRKVQLTLRIDADVLEWFKAQGRGYQTKMNMLLRAYMDEVQAATRLHESQAEYKADE